LSELGHEVYFLFGELQKSISNNNINYICNTDLDDELVNSFDAIMFCKHNDGAIDGVIEKNTAIKDLFGKKIKKEKKDGLFKPYVVCKTCIIPEVKYFKKTLCKDISHIFDYFFLQTDNVKLTKCIVRSIIGIKRFYKYKEIDEENCFRIKNVHAYGIENNIDTQRAQYSDMFVPKTINFGECPFVKNTKYTLIYIGRLRQNYGMVLPFIMKLMNKLGSDFKLIILPGSFNIPNQKPLIKYNPKKSHHIKALRNYFKCKNIKFLEEYKDCQVHKDDYINDEEVKCNIEVFDPVAWGEQYNYIAHCDVALNFSPNRSRNYLCEVANTKVFDYLGSGVPVVSEKGCQNNYMISNYNAGVVVNDIGSIENYYSGILEIINKKYDHELIKTNFINNENYVKRAEYIAKVLM